MDDTVAVEDYDRLPLRYAYQYLNKHGLNKESHAIQWSKDMYKSYGTSLRRGKVVHLLKSQGLLDDFINQLWPNGNTEQGKRHLKRVSSIHDAWIEAKSQIETKVTSMKDEIQSQVNSGLRPDVVKLIERLLNDVKTLQEENTELTVFKTEVGKYQDLRAIFEDERFMEDWLERNIHKVIPSLEVIDRQPIATWKDGLMRNRPDLFCLDKTTRELVIVENKIRGRHRNLETQLLTYRSWVKRNLDKINETYKTKNLVATQDFRFVIITDTSDEKLEAICEDTDTALVVIRGSVLFDQLVPYWK